MKGEPNTALGRGRLNISAAIRAANRDKLEYLVVELDACATDVMEAVRESYWFLTQGGLGSGTH